jgi:uncharacterized membrane protein
MWREELWHPVVVHFPIALLLVGSGGYALAMALRGREKASWLLPASRAVLILGTLGGWVAVFTGLLADSEVGRDLCDPLVLNAHENNAFLVCFLFAGAILLDLLAGRFLPSERWKRWGRGLALAVLLAGAAVLGYVGHLGGKLVYQQAAGVHQPSEDCAEFVK